MTFRKGKAHDGRARRAETYSARISGKEVATIQRIGYSPWVGADEAKAWFWYADGVNTASAPQTLADCKESVRKHFGKAQPA